MRFVRACVKDCLHQALRMDIYPVMVDEGHCCPLSALLAVCPTVHFHVGAALC